MDTKELKALALQLGGDDVGIADLRAYLERQSQIEDSSSANLNKLDPQFLP
jgi:hypothetical protein